MAQGDGLKKLSPPRLPAVTVSQYPKETTRLTPYLERFFQRWVQDMGIENADDPRGKYDYRGAFRAGLKPMTSAVDGYPHWPDTYKQHGHPSFSVESQYSGGPFDGGAWGGPDGETYLRQLPPIAPRDATNVLRKR